MVLTDRLKHFVRALKETMEVWNGPHAESQHIYDVATRSMVIQRHWYSISAEALRDDSGVKLVNNYERHCFEIDGEFALRFKHLNSKYRPRNNSNFRSRAWVYQLNLPDLPPMPRLDFGYRLDLTGTIVETAMIMLCVGKEPSWRWQIWGDPIDVFAGTPEKDLFGRTVYAFDDYSEVD